MMPALPYERLKQLTEHAAAAHTLWNLEDGPNAAPPTKLKDSVDHLPSQAQFAWRRVLSSIATTEALEKTVMEPLLASVRDAKLTTETAYLASHSLDEHRHAALLKTYLVRTFGYVKAKPTFTDRWIYEKLIPAGVGRFRASPIVGFALIHAYEAFSLEIYPQLILKAQEDRVPEAHALLRQISKDELRHVAGVKALIELENSRRGTRALSTIEAATLRAFLALMVVDTELSPAAVYNRELAVAMGELGISPSKMRGAALKAGRETLELFREGQQLTEAGSDHVSQ